MKDREAGQEVGVSTDAGRKSTEEFGENLIASRFFGGPPFVAAEEETICI